MKKFSYFFIGFIFALLFIIFMDFELLETLHNCNFKPLIKYIGPATFGGLMYMVICRYGERLDKIEKDINKLKENEKTS